MRKNIYKTPIDEHTCTFCKERDGKEVVSLLEAANIQEGCTNRGEDGKSPACRCYVALDDGIEEIDGYLFIKVNKLLEIANDLFDDFYRPHKDDAGEWLTLLNKVRKASNKNYRFSPSDWGLGELEGEE